MLTINNKKEAVDFISGKILSRLNDLYLEIENGDFSKIGKAINLEASLIGVGRISEDNACYLGNDPFNENDSILEMSLFLFDEIRSNENSFSQDASADIERCLAYLGYLNEDEFEYAESQKIGFTI